MNVKGGFDCFVLTLIRSMRNRSFFFLDMVFTLVGVKIPFFIFTVLTGTSLFFYFDGYALSHIEMIPFMLHSYKSSSGLNIMGQEG